MGFVDSYYYGQCKIICEAETVDDNGRTVAITDGTTTQSAALVDKIAEFLVPGRAQYTITLLDGDVNKFTTTIEAGYGECIHVMLADGYAVVRQKEFDEMNEKLNGVDSRVDTLAGQVGEYQFGLDGSGRPSYRRGGADTWHPFSQRAYVVYNGTNMKSLTPFWNRLTNADFIAGCKSAHFTFGCERPGENKQYGSGGSADTGNASVSYNASNGVVTVNGFSGSASAQTAYNEVGSSGSCSGRDAFAVYLGTVAGK